MPRVPFCLCSRGRIKNSPNRRAARGRLCRLEQAGERVLLKTYRVLLKTYDALRDARISGAKKGVRDRACEMPLCLCRRWDGDARLEVPELFADPHRNLELIGYWKPVQIDPNQ